MMVENDTSSVEYQLSTSTGPFSIPFYFIENGHIVAELYTQNGDDFNKTTLTIDVDYYLNGAGDKNGGQLTLLSAHSGATLLIYRDPDATQLTSYLATGKFPATSHERALDKLTMLIQKFGWWWDSLALKKPNIFANYYDALNNRIRNLRDPSLAQDAATKSYVDSSDIDLQQQITSNFNRSLRVNDSYISQLPSAQDRAWKGLGFDGAGQPKLQDPAGTGLWGYVPAIGSFEQGSLLTQRFEVLLWESTDEYWRWDGVMPKVVLPGSTPATAGGTGKGKWIDVTDATLRSNLGSGEADLGGALVSIDNATVRELAENNIFRKMTRADINTMLNTPGAEVDVEYALQALIDEGHKSILFPHDVKGIYILAGNVTVPAPVTLISFSPCVKP
ncbi:tail fiber/spike domain-containing protein, partial [Klebsiella pneumoniae]